MKEYKKKGEGNALWRHWAEKGGNFGKAEDKLVGNKGKDQEREHWEHYYGGG